MSRPGVSTNSDRRADLIKKIDARLELLALRLEVHGLEAATPERCRELRDKALELRNLLRSHGFTRTEIAELMGNAHPTGCACWGCVRALHKAVCNHVAKLHSRHKAK